LTSLAEHAGWLSGFETASLDTMIRLRTGALARHTVIVAIDETDYASAFQGRSPLSPSTLEEILVAIAKGAPAVIGVDLDVEPLAAHGSGSAGIEWPPVVWARTPGPDPAGHGGSAGALESGAPAGLALFPQDGDGIVRRHRRIFPEYELDGRPASSLAWAVTKAYCERSGARSEALGCRELEVSEATDSEDLVLNFAGDAYRFPRVSVRDVLQASRGDAWSSRGPLTGRVVLVGGTYYAARDEHVTPVGRMSGVELVAQAVESELQGTGIRERNAAVMLALELMGGFLVVWVYQRFGTRLGFYVSIIAIPIAALVFSLLSFYSFSRWASFVPVLFGAWIHELYARGSEARRAGTGGGPLG
jgi:CHASE2 domain-containing sensor protein